MAAFTPVVPRSIPSSASIGMHPGKADQSAEQGLSSADHTRPSPQGSVEQPPRWMTSLAQSNETKIPPLLARNDQPLAILPLLNDAIDVSLIQTQRFVDDAVALDSISP